MIAVQPLSVCTFLSVSVDSTVFDVVENTLTELLPLGNLSLIVGDDLLSPVASMCAGIWSCLTLFEDIVYAE